MNAPATSVGWIELSCGCRHPEFAAELLEAAGAEAVSLLDAGDDPVLEPPPGATPLWPETRVVGLFRDDENSRRAAQSLRDNLPADSRLQLTWRTVEDQDWVRAWLAHARPLRFGRLWICPSSHRVERAGATVVELDPGLAFGTGSHPSTALCLDWLARHDLAGARVVDYGCGSGILAVAALKLGAASVLALDIDPQALEATRENAARNGVHERLECRAAGDDDLAPASADVVLANILARPLIALAPHLCRALASGGDIVLAGLLERQTDEVSAAYRPAVRLHRPARRDGWARLAGRRRDAGRRRGGGV